MLSLDRSSGSWFLTCGPLLWMGQRGRWWLEWRPWLIGAWRPAKYPELCAATAAQGRHFYSYLNRRLDVLVDNAGKVISLGLY